MKEERINFSNNHHCVKIEFNDASDLKLFSQGSLNDSKPDVKKNTRKNTKPKKIKKHVVEELRVVMEPQADEPLNQFDNNFEMTPQKINPNDCLADTSFEKIADNDEISIKTTLIFVCHRCDTIFSSRAEFDFHYKNAYEAEPLYSCIHCSKQIQKFTSFRSHSYRHNATERFKCDQCEKGFPMYSLLLSHGSKHEKQLKKCDKCEEKFDNKLMLKVHKKSHGAPRQIDPKKEGGSCPDCGKVLLTSGGLYTHRKIHEDNPRFGCDICGKKFIQKINLIHHHKKHSGLRPYRCTFADCGKTFMEKSHLLRHQNHHSTVRPYICDQCQKAYKTERCLKVHTLVHSNHRPFVCTECNKGFLSSSKLKQHSNIHSGLRPYVCKYCPRDFTNFPNWLKHIRRRHKVDHKTGEKLEVVPTYKKKPPPPLPTVAGADLSSCSKITPPLLVPAIDVEHKIEHKQVIVKTEPKTSFKLEPDVEEQKIDVGVDYQQQQLVTTTTTTQTTPNYESDNGFSDFPDDIDFVLRNDPEYLELLRTRLDLSNDGSNGSSGDDRERHELRFGEHSHEGVSEPPISVATSSNALGDADNFSMPINSLYPILPLFNFNNLPQPFQFINPNSIHLLNGQLMQNGQFRTQ